MSSSSTPTPERESHLLAVGQQCSASLCGLVDFLPFKCQHCNQPFCAEHFRPNQHNCEKYDESQHDRIAPSCPLCNTPVAIPPGQDPNVRMERHFNTECSVTTGKTTKSTAPHCAKAKCGKVLFSPIRCDTCKQQFCPQHRFPKDHMCTTAMSPASKPNASVTQSTSAAGAAALAAFKRATNNANKPSARPSPAPAKAAPQSAKQASPPKASTSTKSAPHNPLSKTDRAIIAHAVSLATNDSPSANDHANDPPKLCIPKSTYNARSWAPPPLRAKAERESKVKAMRARAQKGLLSEEEKAILAAEEAELAQKKGDCIIA